MEAMFELNNKIYEVKKINISGEEFFTVRTWTIFFVETTVNFVRYYLSSSMMTDITVREEHIDRCTKESEI